MNLLNKYWGWVLAAFAFMVGLIKVLYDAKNRAESENESSKTREKSSVLDNEIDHVEKDLKDLSKKKEEAKSKLDKKKEAASKETAPDSIEKYWKDN